MARLVRINPRAPVRKRGHGIGLPLGTLETLEDMLGVNAYTLLASAYSSLLAHVIRHCRAEPVPTL